MPKGPASEIIPDQDHICRSVGLILAHHMPDDFTNPREIAELNIEHFTRLLRTPLDELTRATVERLLVEERQKLAQLPNIESPAPRVRE